MGKIRTVVPDPTAHRASVARHVLRSQQSGATVVFVTANRSYDTLADELEGFGVDVEALHILDVVSRMAGREPPGRLDNVHFLRSPTHLELIALQTERTAATHKDACIIVDCLDCLSIYNDLDQMEQFVHYLASRARLHGIPCDFILADERTEGLHMRLVPMTDGSLPLQALPA